MTRNCLLGVRILHKNVCRVHLCLFFYILRKKLLMSPSFMVCRRKFLFNIDGIKHSKKTVVFIYELLTQPVRLSLCSCMLVGLCALVWSNSDE